MTTISLRLADLKDSAWISELLIDGARHGHFSPTLAAQSADLIRELITRGGITMVKLRGHIHMPTFCVGTVTVADVQGVAASFLITMQDQDELELHLAGTKKAFRRHGCFNALIEHQLASHTGAAKIYSRCFKKSSWAIAAFHKQGFVETSHGEPIELVLQQRK
jgi:hypothetical protein